jgi:hypothetical protein
MNSEQPTPESTDDIKQALKLPKMSDEDLRKFVDDYCSNRIFTSNELQNSEIDLLQMIFLPLSLGCLSKLQPDSLKQVGCIWEYYDKAGPRSINGKPMFMSMNLMHIDDWKRAVTAIEKEEKRRENIEL